MSNSTSFNAYSFADTPKDELENNLTIVNEIIKSRQLRFKPEFHILGGAALVFHSLSYDVTLDIDTANRIESSIKSDVSLFIDDAASEVVKLGKHYTSRLVKYREDLECVQIFLLSLEDLVITKLISARRKDLIALRDSGILSKIDWALLHKILEEEYDTTCKDYVNRGLKMIGHQLHTDE